MEEVEIKTVKISYCRGCIYLARIGHNGMPFCDYIGKTKHRRPCPGGEGCTARKTKTQEAKEHEQSRKV